MGKTDVELKSLNKLKNVAKAQLRTQIHYSVVLVALREGATVFLLFALRSLRLLEEMLDN